MMSFKLWTLRVLFMFVMTSLFFSTVTARGYTINLDKRDKNEPITLALSRNDTNRIEFPETVINAFSSKQSIDVRIVGHSALVKTQEPAELIVLTEKRRLTLMLLPKDIPSRTVIITTDDDEVSLKTERKFAKDGIPLAWEKRIIDLLLFFIQQNTELPKDAEKTEISNSLFLYSVGNFSDGDLAISVYTLKNTAKEKQQISERMFYTAFPRTVAVGIDQDIVLSEESARVFVITKRNTW